MGNEREKTGDVDWNSVRADFDRLAKRRLRSGKADAAAAIRKFAAQLPKSGPAKT